MESKKTAKSDLQNKKTIFLEIGMAVALAVVLVAFNWSSKERRAAVLVAEPTTWAGFDESVPITTQDLPTPSAGKIKIRIPNDILVIVDEPIDISDISFVGTTGDSISSTAIWGNPIPQLSKQEDDIIEEIPYVLVEKKPLFQGKDAGEFRNWIYSQVVYPRAALENGIQGTVVLSFIVNTDGRLSDIKTLRKVDPLLYEAVIEIVKNSPEWTPGRQQNKPVRVTYQVPIVFKINK
ncbi:MAG: energy transducer TonB [Prevotellaceae bacterium]|jgi:protein TonB|nr:energy transducer TonB [Prevotellaceae bacterium]